MTFLHSCVILAIHSFILISHRYHLLPTALSFNTWQKCTFKTLLTVWYNQSPSELINITQSTWFNWGKLQVKLEFLFRFGEIAWCLKFGWGLQKWPNVITIQLRLLRINSYWKIINGTWPSLKQKDHYKLIYGMSILKINKYTITYTTLVSWDMAYIPWEKLICLGRYEFLSWYICHIPWHPSGIRYLYVS